MDVGAGWMIPDRTVHPLLGFRIAGMSNPEATRCTPRKHWNACRHVDPRGQRGPAARMPWKSEANIQGKT